jgi:FtsP/CotA-like multicopper oxidase with cupredoxin domain
MKPARRDALRCCAALGAGMLAPLFTAPGNAAARPLPARRLAQFVDPLPEPVRLEGPTLDVAAVEFRQKLHRDLPPTRLWGYAGSYPGPTIVATRGTALRVNWTNALHRPALLASLPVDTTLHWADPLGRGHAQGHERGPAGRRGPYRGPVPLVPHLHGGETEPASDGHPDAWFTPGLELRGAAFTRASFDYTNRQPAGTLWYHDHALGITRLTVYAGLAGFYLVRDPALEHELALPSGRFEREILIQDRSFDEAGQLLYPRAGTDPSRHTHWVPEFFGDTIVVNGKCWPWMAVEPRRYRLRLLNGSNARFYRLRLSDGRPFIVIGADGAMLPAPAGVDAIVLAPGERADVVVDFAGATPGSRSRMLNDAPTPFPAGDVPDPRTTGRILEFRIGALSGPDASNIPSRLAPLPELGTPALTRRLTLQERMGPRGPVAVLLDDKLWSDPPTETPRLGTTEHWEIYNLTEDAHPIHLHLVHFQVLGRQPVRVDGLARALRDGRDPSAFLPGPPLPPEPGERGWKDTVRANPREVTRFAVRFAPMEGGSFPFDATAHPGYVWHCHVLEHEDNEMMRPLRPRP